MTSTGEEAMWATLGPGEPGRGQQGPERGTRLKNPHLFFI